MAYPKLKEKARKLRLAGYSYNMISEKVGVAKSTLHYWLVDIPYTPNKAVVKRIGLARAKSGEVKSRQKRESIAQAKAVAKTDLHRITARDLFMLGLGLYIGDGAKTANVAVINSDVRVIRLAMQWFESACGLPKEHFRLSVHLYPDNNVEECLQFWSSHTGIPRSQFGKTQVDVRAKKKMAKRGKLLYGTAHLVVKSNGRKEFGVFLQRRITAWMDIVLDEHSAGVV